MAGVLKIKTQLHYTHSWNWHYMQRGSSFNLVKQLDLNGVCVDNSMVHKSPSARLSQWDTYNYTEQTRKIKCGLKATLPDFVIMPITDTSQNIVPLHS